MPIQKNNYLELFQVPIELSNLKAGDLFRFANGCDCIYTVVNKIPNVVGDPITRFAIDTRCDKHSDLPGQGLLVALSTGHEYVLIGRIDPPES